MYYHLELLQNTLYPLPAWSADEIEEIRAEASREADNERRRRNVGAGAAAPAPVQPAVVGGGAVQQSSTEEVVPGALDIRGEDGVWVFAESSEGYRYGDRVQGVVSPPVVGEKIVHTMPNGRKVLCICINEKGVEDFNGRPALCDGRILPRKNNSLGVPEMSLSDAAARSKQYDLGWKVVGPRTAKWCLAYLSVEGLGLEGHHERFRQFVSVGDFKLGSDGTFPIVYVCQALDSDRHGEPMQLPRGRADVQAASDN